MAASCCAALLVAVVLAADFGRVSRTPNFSVLRRNAAAAALRAAIGCVERLARSTSARWASGVPKCASTSQAGTLSFGTYKAARTESWARYRS